MSACVGRREQTRTRSNPGPVGAVSSLGAVGGLVGAFISPWIAKRVPGRLLVMAVSWTECAVIVGIALVSNPWLIGVLLALLMVFIAPLNVVFSTYEARSIPDSTIGTVRL